MWKDWPGRWGRDAGIDLVAETADGRLMAVQSKAYREDRRIRKGELDKWLAESGRAEFSCRLLITTSAAGLSHTAANTLAAQEKPVIVVDRAALRAGPVDWPDSFEALPHPSGNTDVERPRRSEPATSCPRPASADAFVATFQVQDPRFERWMALLEGFVEAHGHARVAANYNVDGRALGRWVIPQRQLWRRGRLAPRRAQALEALPGWTFSPYDSAWLDNHHQLARFISTHGSPSVPVDFVAETGLCLAAWIVNQRTRHAAGRLAPHRVRLLEALPGWTWTSGGHLQRCGRK